MILHTITGNPEVWALAEGRYWHVADIASLNAYRALPDSKQVVITAAEHASILASAPSAAVVQIDAATAGLIGAAIAAKVKLPSTIELSGQLS